MHAFDEVANLCGGHAFAGGELAEAEFGGFAAVLGLSDPAGHRLARCGLERGPVVGKLGVTLLDDPARFELIRGRLWGLLGAFEGCGGVLDVVW